MSTTTATIHSPSNLVTEDYDYVGGFDTGAPMWAANDWAMTNIRRVNANPVTGDRGLRQCHHCGARLRYVAVLLHRPTETYIAVGETCLENRFERATSEFHAMRKAAQLDRARQRIREGNRQFAEAEPDLAFMVIEDDDERAAAWPPASVDNEFIADVAWKAREAYGADALTPRQIDAVRRAIVRDAERAQKRAEREAEEAARGPAGPVPTGRVEVVGEVVGRTLRETDFGATMKLMVRLDNGSKLWMSEPGKVETRRGDRVSFRATISASDDDPTFGFGKRPSNFEVVARAEEGGEA